MSHVEVEAGCVVPRIFDNETWRKPLAAAGVGQIVQGKREMVSGRLTFRHK